MGFSGGSVVKNLPTNARDVGSSLGGEDTLEKKMAIHSSILSWKNPMDRGAWQATVDGVARVRHDLATKPPSCIIKSYVHIYLSIYILLYI